MSTQLCPVCDRPRSSTPCPTCGNVVPEFAPEPPPPPPPPPRAPARHEEPDEHEETAADDPRYRPRSEEMPAVAAQEMPAVAAVEEAPPAADAAPAPSASSTADPEFVAAYLEIMRKEATPIGRIKAWLADLPRYWPMLLCGLGIVIILMMLVASGVRTRAELRHEFPVTR